METMHLMTWSAYREPRNHAVFGESRAVWTPGGQGVAGSNPVSPTKETPDQMAYLSLINMPFVLLNDDLGPIWDRSKPLDRV